MREAVWEAIDGDGDVPSWLVKGRTVLIPKDGCTGRGLTAHHMLEHYL